MIARVRSDRTATRRTATERRQNGRTYAHRIAVSLGSRFRVVRRAAMADLSPPISLPNERIDIRYRFALILGSATGKIKGAVSSVFGRRRPRSLGDLPAWKAQGERRDRDDTSGQEIGQGKMFPSPSGENVPLPSGGGSGEGGVGYREDPSPDLSPGREEENAYKSWYEPVRPLARPGSPELAVSLPPLPVTPPSRGSPSARCPARRRSG